jgi:succinoglycan biosynthesis protein ExoW
VTAFYGAFPAKSDVRGSVPTMSRKKIAVVIPFFQRKSGLLRNAVQSALNQAVDAELELVIVDDGSPVRAEDEIDDLLRTHSSQIKLVKQPNGGCYPASNTALDHVTPDTDFVAFLDSDDVWFDGHLQNALWALTHGFDFYFSDFYQLNQTVTAFNRAKRLNISEHRLIHASGPVYSFDRDMVAQILTGNILGTSTIVYNFRKFPALRYRTEFAHTGGEYILWLQLALGTKSIAFSGEPECRYGGGVNIYSESAWGTDKFLGVVSDEIKYKKWILANLDVSAAQKVSLTKTIREKRLTFCKGLMHNAVHSRISLRVLRKHMRVHPATFFMLPVVPGIVLFERFKAT